MSMTLETGVVWGVGMLLQALLLIGFPMQKKQFGFLIAIMIGSLFGFLPGKHESVYGPHAHIFEYFMMFAFFFALVFKKELLSVVNEYIVMMCTILFLYVSYETFGSSWMFLLSCVPAVLLIPWIFEAWKPKFRAKAFLYIWYLFTITMIGMSLFHLGVLSPFFDEAHPIFLPLPVAFLSGMSFLCIGIHLVFLFLLLPIPGKHESFAHRWEQVKHDISLMASRFSGQQERFSVLLCSALFCGAFLVINALWKPVSDLLIINVILVGMPYIHGLFQILFGAQPSDPLPATSSRAPRSTPPDASSIPSPISGRRSR